MWIACFPLIHIWMSFKCNLNWIIWVYCACLEKIISSQSNHNILVKLIGESHAQRGVRNCSLSNQGVASSVILQESVWASMIQYFHLTLWIEQTLLTFAEETRLWEMICAGRGFRGRVCPGAWRCSPVFFKEWTRAGTCQVIQQEWSSFVKTWGLLWITFWSGIWNWKKKKGRDTFH